MKKYEVIATQVKGNMARVIHKEFDDCEVARQYAHDLCINDTRVVSCSLYEGHILIMDVL